MITGTPGLMIPAFSAAISGKEWPRKFLQYFLALGAGYMLAVAFVEVIPESVQLSGESALLYVLIGYFLVHLFEHTLAPHFHFGEETHLEEISHQHARASVLVGMTIHTFFDGVAIAAGFLVSTWLGAVMFFAVFLHKLPEGFTMASVMLAGGRGSAMALNSALFLGAMTVLGVMVINLEPSWVRLGLPLSAGVTIYVAATDLVPEVNREPGIRMALVFFVGVVVFFLLRLLGPG